MEYYSIFSWGIVIFAAAGAVYIYRPEVFQNLLASAPAQAINEKVAPMTAAAKSKKAKKQTSIQEIGSATKANEDARTSKKRKIVAPVDKTVSVVKTDGQKVELPRDTEESVSDKEFAQQLAKAQAGTNIQSKSQSQPKGPSRLSAAVQPSQSEERLSTGGHDADDDLSSVDTPQQVKSSGKDISDMLEPGAAAPTTLRVTSIPNEKAKSKAKPQQFEQVTSKKKRNEQARREEQRRLNEESERQHERKKQEQLRTARMAAGTSNQTKANNFASTAQNAWQTKTPAAENTSQVSSASLLDTFEPSRTQPSVQTQPLSNITNQPVASGNATELKAKQGQKTTSAFAASARERASFSEEEQNQRIRETQQEDAWESVQSKKSKKKTRKDNSSESSQPSTRSHSHSRASTAQTNGSKVNGTTKAPTSSNRFAAVAAAGTGGLEADEWEA